VFEAILLLVPIPLILFYGEGSLPQWFALAMLFICLPGILVMRGGAPFVATPKRIMDGMLRLAAIKPGETVIDAGCGDGRMVFAAAKLGAKAVGYELSVPTFALAKLRSFFHPGSAILYKDIWKQDYRGADVVFCYLLIDTMKKFEKTVWPTLKPGARVVSHAFKFKDVVPDGEDSGAYLYVKK
jgi:SAM-dependent methyltransferase